MKALIIKSNMQFESHLYLSKFTTVLHISLLTTLKYVGTDDKIVHFNTKSYTRRRLPAVLAALTKIVPWLFLVKGYHKAKYRMYLLSGSSN